MSHLSVLSAAAPTPSSSGKHTAASPAPVFRIDEFRVPTEALPAFMARVRSIDQAVKRQPGCLQNRVLTRLGPAGATLVLTLVEWASEDAMAQARTRIQAGYAAEGFDPAAFMRELGITPDMGNYRPA